MSNIIFATQAEYHRHLALCADRASDHAMRDRPNHIEQARYSSRLAALHERIAEMLDAGKTQNEIEKITGWSFNFEKKCSVCNGWHFVTSSCPSWQHPEWRIPR